MSLRDALIAAGVAPRDIDEAIGDSRRVVGRAAAGARFLSHVVEQIGTKQPPGSKRQAAALIGSLWLERFAEETSGMLRRTGKR